MRPPTPEEAFRQGALAMQSKLVAIVMLGGNTRLAGELLTAAPPSFQMPEVQEIRKPE
jgi:hypothetical protein